MSDSNAQFEITADANQEGESMIRFKGGQDSVAKRPKVKMTDPFACQLVAKHYENADEL